MTTEKIIMVDRVPEKLSDEDMKKIRDEYAAYCVSTYKAVQNLDIANKDAKDIVFNHILSPLQYFIEDKVRIKRLSENRLGGEPQQRPQGGYNNTPRGPVNGAVQQQAPQMAKPQPAQPAQPAKQQWKNRY
jgi:hypothetical protein